MRAGTFALLREGLVAERRYSATGAGRIDFPDGLVVNLMRGDVLEVGTHRDDSPLDFDWLEAAHPFLYRQGRRLRARHAKRGRS